MPIFEYRCNKCGCEFEELILGKSDADALICPSCGVADVEKKLSLFGFSSKNEGNGDKFVSSSGSSACGGCTAASCAGCSAK